MGGVMLCCAGGRCDVPAVVVSHRHIGGSAVSYAVGYCAHHKWLAYVAAHSPQVVVDRVEEIRREERVIP